MNPTDEQIKEFWEWCGFKSRLVWSDPADIVPRHQFKVWDYPDTCDVTQNLLVNPILDLNNLFKYAVPNPKIKTVCLCDHFNYDNDIPRRDGYEATVMWDKMDNVCGANDKDPALALFWAIYKVVK